MSTDETQISDERLARSLRDAIYGQAPFGRPISDEQWANIGHKWVEDLPWLAGQVARLVENAS